MSGPSSGWSWQVVNLQLECFVQDGLFAITCPWVIHFMIGLALWTPAELYPTTWSHFERWFACILGLKPSSSDRRTAFKLTVFVAAVLLTGLSLVYPVANAFMLFSFIAPILLILQYEYRYHGIGSCIDPRKRAVVRLAKTSFSWLAAAVVCWLNDRLFCRWWQSLPIPYPQLHAVWHVFILIAAYTMCIVASWAYAERMVPTSQPEIRYVRWYACNSCAHHEQVTDWHRDNSQVNNNPQINRSRYWPFRSCGIPFVQIEVKNWIWGHETDFESTCHYLFTWTHVIPYKNIFRHGTTSYVLANMST